MRSGNVISQASFETITTSPICQFAHVAGGFCGKRVTLNRMFLYGYCSNPTFPTRLGHAPRPMPRPEHQHHAGETLNDVLVSLTQGVPVSEQPEGEEWSAAVERMSVADRIAQITEETWYWFLEVLPPKLLRGNFFAFSEGQEPLKIFWRRRGQHFCRQLTWEETWRVCEASGLPRDYGCR